MKKTFSTLLFLCLLIPSLVFSENSFERNCRVHQEAASEGIKKHDELIEESKRIDQGQVDDLLTILRKALAEINTSKGPLEQILKILNQPQAKNNLSMSSIEEKRNKAKIDLEKCDGYIENLNHNILVLSNAKKEAEESLQRLKLKKKAVEKEPIHNLPFNPETYWEREKERRALFYLRTPFATKAHRDKTETIIPLDGQTSGHSLYTGQFYRTSVSGDFQDLIVKVYEQEKLLYEERIHLYSPSSEQWDQHLKDEGLLLVPKTTLSKEYGLDLRLTYISDHQYLIAQKGSYSNYTFKLFLHEKPLYTLHFIEPPPWQLGVLKKPALPCLSKPLVKQLMTQSKLNTIPSSHKNHPLLVQFVQDMGADPLSIAQYVQNEIELDLNSLKKEGVLFTESLHSRSPLGTFLEEQGSPFEQCDLLVHLLELAGYKAVLIYPSHNVSLPSYFAERLLFVELGEEEEAHLAFPGVLFQDGDKEIILYPWIKEINVEEGYDLYNVLPESFASQDQWIKGYLTGDERITKHIGQEGKDDTAAVLFLRFLEEELKKQNLSIKDVGIDRKICKKQFNDWDDFPRPHAERDDTEKFHFKNGPNIVQITIGSHENPNKTKSFSLPLPTLNGRAIELIFSPSEFHLQVDDEPWKNLTLPLDTNDSTLFVQLSLKGSSSRVFSFARGTRAALCFNMGRVTSKHLSLFQEAFEKEKDESKRLHRLLSFMGMAYFEKCSSGEEKLAGLHKIHPITYFSAGLAKLSPDLSTGQLVFPQVDMQFYLNFSNELSPLGCHQVRGNAIRQLMDFLIVDTSSNEHQIIRDLFQDEHPVSTVKLLEIANKDNQGILAFTKGSFQRLDQLFYLQLRALSRGQWASLKTIFDDSNGGHLSYAYMTPGRISNGENPPSYTGTGVLIFHPFYGAALISDHDRLMNGGFGSRLPQSFLSELGNNQRSLSPYKNGFTLLKISDELLSFASFESKYPTETNQQLLEHFQKTWLTADVRPDHKFETNLVADPVDVVSGAYYIDEVDLTLPGSFPLQIRRNYSNQSPLPGLFGFGWKLGLNPYLHEEGDKLLAAEEDGTVIVYRLNSERNRWVVLAEDNPDLRNFGGTANPFHSYIEAKENTYTLYSPDGSKRHFENYLLRKWIDAVGDTLTFSYKDKQLIRIENSNDNFIGFYYNPEGKISEAYTKDGRRVEYHYTYQGDLDCVILPNDAAISYVYDANHQILQETKPHGRVLENIYNEKGRVVEQRSPVGRQQQIVTSATFKFDQGMTIVTDGEGGTTQYLIYDKQIYKITDPVGNETLRSWFIDDKSYFDAKTGQVLPWDQAGAWPQSLKTTQDKRGLITEYRYDKCGNPTSITLLGEDLTGKGDAQIGKQLKYNDRNLCAEEVTLNRTTCTYYHDHFAYLPKKIEKWIDDQLISIIHFDYDEKGQLIKQDADGMVNHWVYEKGFPVQIIQETGTEDPNVISTLKYNRQGQCIEKVSSDGIERHEYDIMGNNLITSLYDLSEKLLSTKYFGYNLNNQVVWQQGPDPLNTLFIDYNAAGQVMASRQTLTQVNPSSGGIEEADVAYTLYEYDTRGELIEEVNPLGVSTCRKLDSMGRPTSITTDSLTNQYTYEPGGFVASILSPTGAKTSRFYTTNGLLKKEIYPDGTESTCVYDYFGRPVLQSKNGMTLEITYDDILNTVTKTQRESGIKEISRFDAHGNLITSTDAEGYTWTKSYDLLNRMVAETDPEGHTTTWSYGEDTVSCTLPSGETTIQSYAAGQLVESKTINVQGDLLSHQLIRYYPEQSTVEEISGNIVTTTQTNTLGQPLLVQQGELITIFQYDHAGRCIASADGEGRATQREFDKLGRTTKQILPDGTPIRFTYDEGLNLVAYHLPDNITWQATYDLMGRKTGESLHANNQSTQNWEYTYENGLLKLAKDPLGRTHAYTYDSALRLIAEHIGQISRTYAYDQRGLLTSAEQTGQDYSIINRGYSPSGNLIFEAISLNGELLQQTDQTWTPSSRTLEIGDHRRDFHYEAGQLKRLSSSGLEFSYKYALSGALKEKKTPFYSIDLSYNISGLPETRKTHLGSDTYQESLSWNHSGRLARYDSNLQAPSEKTFSYNSRGYLKSAGQDQFEFDFGKQGRGIRTSAPDHLIPTSGLDPFGKILTEMLKGKTSITTYDQAGQTTSRDGKEQFEWDPWGNLIAVSTPNYTWKASYDPFGHRLQTTYTKKGLLWNTFLKTTSLFDPEHEFQEIGVKYNNKTFWKLYGPTSCDALIDNAGNTLGLLQDALGNLKAVISHDNTQWIEELPSPYGPTGTPLTLEPDLLTYAKSLTWQDNKLDPTGLVHLGARYYDPKIGRFLSPDPISYPSCLDLYTYANGDPINFHDPNGRFSSPFYQPIKETVLSTLANPRFQGGLRAAGGLTEAVAGAVGGTATAWSGVGLVAGGIVVAHGTDNFVSGMYQALTGEYRDPLTVQMIKNAGFSDNTAHFVNDTATSLFTIVSAVPVQAGQHFASKLALNTQPKRVINNANNITEPVKKAGRNRFSPDINAVGDHTVFRRDPLSGRVSHYETYRLQTNPKNPNPWESVKRYDGPGSDKHWNKILERDVFSPHVHDPNCPGSIRPAETWEIPN